MHLENERLRAEVTRLDALIDRGLFAEVERLERTMKAHRETAVAAIAGAERQVIALRTLLAQSETEKERLWRENERLVVDNAELSAECDQWGEKMARTWAELDELRRAQP